MISYFEHVCKSESPRSRSVSRIYRGGLGSQSKNHRGRKAVASEADKNKSLRNYFYLIPTLGWYLAASMYANPCLRPNRVNFNNILQARHWFQEYIWWKFQDNCWRDHCNEYLAYTYKNIQVYLIFLFKAWLTMAATWWPHIGCVLTHALLVRLLPTWTLNPE